VRVLGKLLDGRILLDEIGWRELAEHAQLIIFNFARSLEKKWVHENVSLRSVYDGQLHPCMSLLCDCDHKKMHCDYRKFHCDYRKLHCCLGLTALKSTNHSRVISLCILLIEKTSIFNSFQLHSQQNVTVKNLHCLKTSHIWRVIPKEIPTLL
jgi:hypothetical protein